MYYTAIAYNITDRWVENLNLYIFAYINGLDFEGNITCFVDQRRNVTQGIGTIIVERRIELLKRSINKWYVVI